MDFTEKDIKALAYCGYQERFWFDHAKDFGLNVGSKKLSFIIRYQHPDTKRRKVFTVATFPYGMLPELKEIENLYLVAKMKINNGICPLDERQSRKAEIKTEAVDKVVKGRTLGDVWLEYKRHKRFRQLAYSTQGAYAKCWDKRVGKWYKNTPLVDLNTPEILLRLEGETDALFNEALSLLRNLQKLAIQRGYIKVPFTYGIDRQTTGERDRFLEGKELTKFLHWLQEDHDDWPSYRNLMMMQLLTGCRISEVAQLKWSEIDTEEGIITIPPTRIKTEKRAHKNPKPLLIPIMPAIQKVLDKQRDLHPHFVFPQLRCSSFVTTASIWSQLHKGGWELSSHDLRRTVITIAAEDERTTEEDLKQFIMYGLLDSGACHPVLRCCHSIRHPIEHIHNKSMTTCSVLFWSHPFRFLHDSLSPCFG